MIEFNLLNVVVRLKKQVNELADKKVPSIGDLLTDGITTSKQTKNIFDWEVMESGDKEGGKSLYQTLIDRVTFLHSIYCSLSFRLVS